MENALTLKKEGQAFSTRDEAEAESDRLSRAMPVEAIAYYEWEVRPCNQNYCKNRKLQKEAPMSIKGFITTAEGVNITLDGGKIDDARHLNEACERQQNGAPCQSRSEKSVYYHKDAVLYLCEPHFDEAVNRDIVAITIYPDAARSTLKLASDLAAHPGASIRLSRLEWIAELISETGASSEGQITLPVKRELTLDDLAEAERSAPDETSIQIKALSALIRAA